MKSKTTVRRFPAGSRDWRRALARAPQRVADANCSYDPNDPVAVAQAYANAQLRYPGQRGPQKAPTKVAVTIRYSRDVIGYFKSTGPGWQARMDKALLQFVARRATAGKGR